MFDCFGEAVAVLDVAAEVADAGVEDIAERVFSEEKIAQNAHAAGIFVL